MSDEPAPSPYLQLDQLRRERDEALALLRECYQYMVFDEVPSDGMKAFGKRVRRALGMKP